MIRETVHRVRSIIRRNRGCAVLAAAPFVFGMIGALGRGEDQPAKSRFTMVRIGYATPGMNWYRFGQGPPWSHDYPRSERHLMKIVTNTE